MSPSLAIHTTTHKSSGASIQIHPLGATLISYKTNGSDVLFCSKQALMDGSKPIRGGVPLVFPNFGPPKQGDMPQHGYARRNVWTCVKEYDTEAAAGAVWELDPSAVKDGLGSQTVSPCTLRYTVEFSAKQITTTITVCNTTAAVPFQTLLHTYYTVENALDATQCFVKGLQGYAVTDKVSPSIVGPIGEAIVAIKAETDCIYSPPAGTKDVEVTIGTGKGRTVSMVAKGVVNGESVPVSCVVWNPYIEKAAALGDFGNEEYKTMICVEPGILGDDAVVAAGKEASLTQIITL